MKKEIILLATLCLSFNAISQVAITLPEMDLEEQYYFDNWVNNTDTFFVVPVKLNEYVAFQSLSFNLVYDPTIVTPITDELIDINSHQYMLVADYEGSADFAMLESGQITAEVFPISSNENMLTITYSFNEDIPEAYYNDYNGNLMYLAFKKVQACYEAPLFFNFFDGNVDGDFVNPDQTNAFVINDLTTTNGDLITENGIVTFSIIMADAYQNGSLMEANVTGGALPYSYNWTDKLDQTLDTNPFFSPQEFTDYLLYVTDANGCVSSVYFSFVQTSINEYTALKIFPNPAKESIQIQLDQMEYHYQLLDINGQLIESGHANSSTTIYRNAIPNGMYFLRIQFQNQTITNKIIFN
jgi:hypothetical protein